MDLNFKRRARERQIASEVATELFQALKPAMDAGADAKTLIDENRGLIAHIFGMACERHQLNEAAAAAVGRALSVSDSGDVRIGWSGIVHRQV